VHSRIKQIVDLNALALLENTKACPSEQIGGFPFQVEGLDPEDQALKAEERAVKLLQRFPDFETIVEFTQELNPNIEIQAVSGEKCEKCSGNLIVFGIPHGGMVIDFCYCMDCTEGTQLTIL